ncbi:hypothetical protein MIR68_011806 [Amoeboaphelidium protococcarum]|nr:hypothetical protein MIR68_011806 [Amoeboaphelidium protococcarum]
MSSLFSVCKAKRVYSIMEDEDYDDWLTACAEIRKSLNKSKRTLFIFFYAGHATKSSTSSSLILTSKFENAIDDGICSTQRNFSRINTALLDDCRANPLMDVLMVADSCCAAVGGRGNVTTSGRIEFIAATTETGISNTRDDGQTFTQVWCKATNEPASSRAEFTTDDIAEKINDDRELAQYPRLFVKHQGKGLPISFSKPRGDAVVVLSKKPTQLPVVLVAFHLAESPSDDAVKDLTEYLAKSDIPISVLAALLVDSTLLLIELPELLLDFLHLDQCYVTLWPLAKTLMIDRNSLLHTVFLSMKTNSYGSLDALEVRLREWIADEIPWISPERKQEVQKIAVKELRQKWVNLMQQSSIVEVSFSWITNNLNLNFSYVESGQEFHGSQNS